MELINLFRLKFKYCKNKTIILKMVKIKICIKNMNLDTRVWCYKMYIMLQKGYIKFIKMLHQFGV